MTPDVIGIGLCTVDEMFVVSEAPDFGKRVRTSDYLRQPGGMAATALVALARLGVSTRFVGRVGDDAEGVFIRDEFVREGVDVSELTAERRAVSTVALVLVREGTGERCFASRGSTCAPLAPGDLNRTSIASSRALLLDQANAVSLQAARWAREAGVCTVLDGTWSRGPVDELLALTDVPIVSMEFVEDWMPGASAEIVLDALYEISGRMAVVTRGEAGCIVRWEKGAFSFPAFPVTVVDTTAAGDAFHGAFIYGLLQGWAVEEIVRLASAVAAMNCRALGGRTGLPTLAEVTRFLAEADFSFVPMALT